MESNVAELAVRNNEQLVENEASTEVHSELEFKNIVTIQMPDGKSSTCRKDAIEKLDDFFQKMYGVSYKDVTTMKHASLPENERIYVEGMYDALRVIFGK